MRDTTVPFVQAEVRIISWDALCPRYLEVLAR